MVFKTIYLYLSIGPWIQEKNVMSQNKVPLLVVQLKGQGSDFWHWPSITQGEIYSSSMRKRNANQREGQSKAKQCNAMQCNAKQNKTKKSKAMQNNAMQLGDALPDVGCQDLQRWEASVPEEEQPLWNPA